MFLRLVCATLSMTLLAEELYEPFPAVRPLGMGNAFTSVANDESAMWTNPAGVSRARKARTRDFLTSKIPNIGAGANKNGISIFQSQATGGGSALADTLSENTDIGDSQPYWAHAQAFPVVMFDYSRNTPLAFGLYSNSSTRILTEDSSKDQAKIDLVTDNGAVANANWTTNNNRFSVGMQLRYINRYAYEDNVAITDFADQDVIKERITSGSNKTSAIGIDAGMLFTFADFWFPTLGLSVLNLPTGCMDNYLNPHSEKRETVCGALHSGSIKNEDALSVVDPTDLRAGFSITPRLTRELSLRIALDAHHLNIASGSQNFGLSGIEPQKLVHFGAELFVGNPLQQAPLAVRGGYNQGFATFGFGFNMAYIAFDFATYGVDVSSQSKNVEDRRYISSISLSF